MERRSRVAAYRHMGGKRGDVARAAIEALESRVHLSGASFAAPRSFDAGDGINSVVTGDFNRDGRIDLVTTNQGYEPNFGNNICILLGNGDGTFQSRTDYSVGSNPWSAVVGDFNGDGKTDLATVNRGDEPGYESTVSILLGNGDGTFGPRTDFSVGKNSVSITSGDFNGDGKVDLAVANCGSSTVGILCGNGDGTFQAMTEQGIDEGPECIVSADFNGDGMGDLATANYDGDCVSVLLSNGDGTFRPAPGYIDGRFSEFVATGDFNGDGITDLAATGSFDDILIFLGKGDGTFYGDKIWSLGDSISTILVSDFNGDGKSDLATTDDGSGMLRILLGKGDGTFRGKKEYPFNYGHIVATDFNGDHKIDLALGNAGSGTVIILLGKGNGHFQNVATERVGGWPVTVAVSDFNRDGMSDVATANNDRGGTVSILLGKGNGRFEHKVDYHVDYWADFLVPGDFNGDGNSDLAVACSKYSESTQSYRYMVTIWVGNGDGAFQDRGTYTLGSRSFSIAVGDFNGDGRSDLVAVDTTLGGAVSVLLGRGDGTFRKESYQNVSWWPLSIATGDFNGDGKSDLAVADVSGAVGILLSNGDGSFQDPIYYRSCGELEGYIAYIAVADFNSDGKSDLATANYNYQRPGTAGILLGNGDGTFQDVTEFRAGLFPMSIAMGDFNGDHKRDLAVGNSNRASILLGNGDGSFQSEIDYWTNDWPLSVAAADFNGDGRSDLVTANSDTHTIGILLNTTRPTGLALSGRRVGENQPVGTLVGTLLATNPEPAETFTYSLVSGRGSSGNHLFAISGDQLVTNAVFDHGSRRRYSIRVRMTDHAGRHVDRQFRIRIDPEPGTFTAKHPLRFFQVKALNTRSAGWRGSR